MNALPHGGLPTQRLDTIRARHAAAEGGAWHLDPEPHTDPDTVRTTIPADDQRRTCPTHGYLAPQFDPSICTCPPTT
jgi:hypothetical protein